MSSGTSWVSIVAAAVAADVEGTSEVVPNTGVGQTGAILLAARWRDWNAGVDAAAKVVRRQVSCLLRGL